ncbi:MAG: hydrogenase maturation protease [Pseudomonadota bacterium]
MKTLLLGMGNPILSDDAVGVRLAADLKAKFEGTRDLTIIEECSVGGLNLLDVVCGYERVIIIDSIKTQGAIPGTMYHFTAEALRDTLHLRNVHDTNFATALELGRRLGMAVPRSEDIHILAVEVDDNVTFSNRMTPALERAYPACVATFFHDVETLISL